jgi:hypothetical protein
MYASRTEQGLFLTGFATGVGNNLRKVLMFAAPSGSVLKSRDIPALQPIDYLTST